MPRPPCTPYNDLLREIPEILSGLSFTLQLSSKCLSECVYKLNSQIYDTVYIQLWGKYLSECVYKLNTQIYDAVGVARIYLHFVWVHVCTHVLCFRVCDCVCIAY